MFGIERDYNESNESDSMLRMNTGAIDQTKHNNSNNLDRDDASCLSNNNLGSPNGLNS